MVIPSHPAILKYTLSLAFFFRFVSSLFFPFLSFQARLKRNNIEFPTMAQPSLYNHLAIASALSAIQPDSPASTVQMLWQLILIEYFPIREGYKFLVKSPPSVISTATSNDELNIIVIRIRRRRGCMDPTDAEQETGSLSNYEFDERPVVIVTCKRFAAEGGQEDTSTGRKDAVPDQGWVSGDLEKTTRDRSYEHDNRPALYGALAIGTKVRFYRFDDSGAKAATQQQRQKESVKLHEGVLIDLGTEAGLVQAEEVMDQIKAQLENSTSTAIVSR
jgi:hypothetical protein